MNGCGPSVCGPDIEQLKLLIKSIIFDMLNDNTLQAGLKDCGEDWLGKGRHVVVCEALADLICDLINEGKLCVPKIAGFTSDCDAKTLTITMADGTELTADASCFGGSGADGNTKIKDFTYDPQTGIAKITDTENREFPVTISTKNTTNKAMAWEPEKQEVSVTDTDDNKVKTPVVFNTIAAPPTNTSPAPGKFIGKSSTVFLGEPAAWLRMLLPDGRVGKMPVYLDDTVQPARCDLIPFAYQNNRLRAYGYLVGEPKISTRVFDKNDVFLPDEVGVTYPVLVSGHGAFGDIPPYLSDPMILAGYIKNTTFDKKPTDDDLVLTNVGWIRYGDRTNAESFAQGIIWEYSPDKANYEKTFTTNVTRFVMGERTYITDPKNIGDPGYNDFHDNPWGEGAIDMLVSGAAPECSSNATLSFTIYAAGQYITGGGAAFRPVSIEDTFPIWEIVAPYSVFSDFSRGATAFMDKLTDTVIPKLVRVATEHLDTTNSDSHTINDDTIQYIRTPWGVIDWQAFLALKNGTSQDPVEFLHTSTQINTESNGSPMPFTINNPVKNRHGLVKAMDGAPQNFGWLWYLQFANQEVLSDHYQVGNDSYIYSYHQRILPVF